MSNLTGQSIGRYQILEQLGEGGMATVYKAYDTRLERDVAIKVIRTDQFGSAAIDKVLKRFEREAKALAKLSHPNIVGVIDYGDYEDVPYLVMTYLPGGTLKERMKAKLPWSEAARLLLPVAHALAYAHSEGVIHRDVKPNNILMARSGDPMLTDFGIAKILDTSDTQTLTGTGVGIGTPEYMAPEQGMGREIDGRADIYSMGIIFYELITGRKPYTADTPMAVVFKHISDPLPSAKQFVPDLPDEVEKILLKALAKKPEDRYEDMQAFADALVRLQAGFAKPIAEIAEQKANSLQADNSERTVDELPFEKPSPAPRHETRSGFQESSSKATNQPSKIQKNWPFAAGLLVLMVLLGWWNWNGLLSSFPIINSLLTRTSDSATINPNAVTDARVKDGMQMVFVPAGSFTMGSDSGPVDESPARTVTLDAFWIDQTEVTNGKYARCLRSGSCNLPADNRSGSRGSYFDDPSFADFPVIKVSWNDASAYCKWAGGRLPSEAEWEKAARGTDGRAYPWGETLNNTYANYGGKDTTRVASYESGKSPYGVYDMAGNVLEWVNDYYAIYPKTPSANPTGPATGEKRVARGGSWLSFNGNIGTTVRFANDPMDASETLGFRCVQAVAP